MTLRGRNLFLGRGSTEEDDPRLEVSAEAFEAVRNVGRHEQQVSVGKTHQLAPAPKRSFARNDNVKLVAIMRPLCVALARNEELDGNIAALKQHKKRRGRFRDMSGLGTEFELDLVVFGHGHVANDLDAVAKRSKR